MFGEYEITSLPLITFRLKSVTPGCLVKARNTITGDDDAIVAETGELTAGGPFPAAKSLKIYEGKK